MTRTNQAMRNDCNWEAIDNFQSSSEFKRFTDWIESQISGGISVEVPVEDIYAVAGLTERWFQCVTSRCVWRLVYPDAPFHGYWGQVA